LTLSEQQHLIWDTASRSTKRLDMLENFGGTWLLSPLGYAYAPDPDATISPFSAYNASYNSVREVFPQLSETHSGNKTY